MPLKKKSTTNAKRKRVAGEEVAEVNIPPPKRARGRPPGGTTNKGEPKDASTTTEHVVPPIARASERIAEKKKAPQPVLKPNGNIIVDSETHLKTAEEELLSRRTPQLKIITANDDEPALNADGSYKEASELEFVNSPSDDVRHALRSLHDTNDVMALEDVPESPTNFARVASPQIPTLRTPISQSAPLPYLFHSADTDDSSDSEASEYNPSDSESRPIAQMNMGTPREMTEEPEEIANDHEPMELNREATTEVITPPSSRILPAAPPSHNTGRVHRSGPLTVTELKLLANLDARLQEQCADLAKQLNRPLTTIMAHITGGRKSTHRRNAHNAREQVQAWVRRNEHSSKSGDVILAAKQVLHDYDNLPEEGEARKAQKEVLDDMIKNLAETIEQGTCAAYVQEGNAYKVIDKLKEEIRQTFHWYHKNYNITAAAAIWPGLQAGDLHAQSKACIVSSSSNLDAVLVHGPQCIQQAVRTLKSFADVTEMTRSDTAYAALDLEPAIVTNKEIAPTGVTSTTQRSSKRANTGSGKEKPLGRDEARKLLTNFLKTQLREHGVSVSEKFQWGGLMNVLYQHRLQLCAWNSRHCQGEHGGKWAYLGMGKVTIHSMTAAHVIEIAEKLNTTEGIYIVPWDEDSKDLPLKDIPKVPLLISRSGRALVYTEESDRYLRDWEQYYKGNARKGGSKQRPDDRNDSVIKPRPRARSQELDSGRGISTEEDSDVDNTSVDPDQTVRRVSLPLVRSESPDEVAQPPVRLSTRPLPQPVLQHSLPEQAPSAQGRGREPPDATSTRHTAPMSPISAGPSNNHHGAHRRIPSPSVSTAGTTISNSTLTSEKGDSNGVRIQLPPSIPPGYDLVVNDDGSHSLCPSGKGKSKGLRIQLPQFIPPGYDLIVKNDGSHSFSPSVTSS